MLVHHRPNLNHRFDQLVWCDDIAQPQRWVQNLAHRACVDDTTDIIQALQTWEWGTGVTKFRVVVVFENVGITGTRKIDQGRSPRETHGHAEGKLMGRGDVDYFGRTLFRRTSDCDSFPVNRPWHDNRPGKAERSASLVKTWVLNPRNLAAIYQCHRADHHCLLRSSGDDDLIRIAARSSVVAQICCQRLAQLSIATACRILEQMRSFLCENLCSEPFPDVDGKFIQRGDGWNKGNARRPSDSKIELLTDSAVGNIFYPIGKPRRTFSGCCCRCRSRT